MQVCADVTKYPWAPAFSTVIRPVPSEQMVGSFADAAHEAGSVLKPGGGASPSQLDRAAVDVAAPVAPLAMEYS
jgi:hypothetical protein